MIDNLYMVVGFKIIYVFIYTLTVAWLVTDAVLNKRTFAMQFFYAIALGFGAGVMIEIFP